MMEDRWKGTAGSMQIGTSPIWSTIAPRLSPEHEIEVR
jgi:hypothetical protein